MYKVYTVGENIIATTKIRNNYGAIKFFLSIAPCKVTTLNPLCILFCIISLFFYGSLSKVIALPTIAVTKMGER